jgi:hypothetical protein
MSTHLFDGQPDEAQLAASQGRPSMTLRKATALALALVLGTLIG